MKASFKQTVSGLALSVLALMLFACGPTSRMHTRAPEQKKIAPIIEDDLVPTSDESSDEPIVKNGVTYQAPAKKISNPHGEIILGRVKMEKTRIIYDPSTRQLTVTGSVRVLNENKIEIGRSEFNLSGRHGEDESKFLLKSTLVTKANSTEAPLVRAKVTCLAYDANGNADCSKAFIDFFIRYKKTDYTEQMELAQKVKSPEAAPTPTSQSPEAPAEPATEPQKDTSNSEEPQNPTTGQTMTPADSTDDLQSEGQEDSIDGRFQGHAETIELDKVFEDDEAKPTAAPETPIKPEPAAPQPAAPQPAAPEQPKTKAPSESPATPAPKPNAPEPQPATPQPAEPQKKEKPLSKDLQQTKNGDIRQINQSVGFPDKGNLRNATSVFAKQQVLNENAFFEVVAPARNRHFATYEMAEIISRLGKNLNQSFSRKLYVGNISSQAGGKLSPHLSHQIGIDADLAYPTTQSAIKFPVVVQMKTRQYNPGSFSVEKTYELLKYAFAQPDIKVERIFADRTIKKAMCEYANAQNEFNSKDKEIVNKLFSSIDHVDGHGDHFHLRLKCSAYDPGCRQKIYAVNKGCL